MQGVAVQQRRAGAALLFSGAVQGISRSVEAELEFINMPDSPVHQKKAVEPS